MWNVALAELAIEALELRREEFADVIETHGFPDATRHYLEGLLETMEDGLRALGPFAGEDFETRWRESSD